MHHSYETIKRYLLAVIFWLTISFVFFGYGTTNAQELASNLSFAQPNETTEAQKQLVSVHFYGEPLSNALHLIANKVNAGLAYKTEDIPDKLITYKAEKTSIYKVLDGVLKGTGLYYSLSENRKVILIKKKEVPKAVVKQETITGTVTDATTGNPLPGVNIVVMGTSNGTATNAEGHYSLEVESLQDTLRFSFIGYQSKTVAIDGRTTINVSLQPQAITGQELVVVGYSKQKRKDITGAVSSIDYGEALQNRPITNASQALSGKMAGVYVSQNSGAPGKDAATIRIRGVGTMNNSDPLVIVDGVPGSLATLNPQNIASITVLKDAASAAIYGSRAANGVVLVTTKKGSYNTTPQISYNGSFGFQELGRHYQLVDNSATFMKLWNRAIINSGGDPIFPQQVIDAFAQHDDPYKYPNTNFFDYVFRTAPITAHNLSVSGGTENSRYYLSANYKTQEGIIRRTNSTSYGLDLNLSTQISDRLEIGGQLRVTREITNQPYDGIGRAIYIFANGAYPFIAPYTKDGKFGATQAVYLQGEQKGEPIVDSRNPLPDLYNGLSKYTNNFFKATFDATFEIAEGLTFDALYSGRYNNNKRHRWNEMNYVYTAGGLRSVVLDYPTTITIQNRYNEEYYWTFYSTLNYETMFADRHNISVLAGVQMEDKQIGYTHAAKSDIPKEGLHEVSSATSNPIAQGSTTGWRMLSYFGRISYNYDNTYLFTANLRADGSSRFKSGNRWGIFPSFSVGWRLSQESFMKSIEFISDFKIRASWGVLGNQRISVIAGNFPYIQAIEASYGTSYNLDGQLVTGAAITELVDQSVSWETTEMWGLGFEMGLFENQFNTKFTYFNKRTRGILVRLPIPQILGGVAAPVRNEGRMKNVGFEVSARYQPQLKGNWNYHIGVNLTYIRNQVTDFQNGNSPDQLYLIREGVSYQALYGYKAIGVYQTDAAAAEHLPNSSYTPVAGDLKYEDVNGDGQINFKDKQVLGNTIPKYTYGINAGISYKNWSFDLVIMGIADVTAYTQNAWTEPLGISGATITKRWLNAWTPENPSTTMPLIRINDTWNRKSSSFWTTDISYFKIKNIQLSYTLPQEWLKTLGLKEVSTYLNMQNVYSFVSDEYTGFDPERSTQSTGYNDYPLARITTLGINLQF